MQISYLGGIKERTDRSRMDGRRPRSPDAISGFLSDLSGKLDRKPGKQDESLDFVRKTGFGGISKGEDVKPFEDSLLY